jgi:hypothetical protein
LSIWLLPGVAVVAQIFIRHNRPAAAAVLEDCFKAMQALRLKLLIM